MSDGRLNLEKPRYDQSHFWGRFRHFFDVTNPRNCLATDEHLENAATLLQQYKRGEEPRGTTNDQVWHAKILYESAFHPDTGEKQTLIGRMSFQVPGGMAITGGLLAFYKTTPQVVLMQLINQTFNAVVNYTNRNAKSPITDKQMAVAYASATTTATGAAMFCNKLTKAAPSILQRWVPFVAVALANCVNIPLMRQQEFMNGVTVFDEDDNPLGCSKKAAWKGIFQVCVSRISMAVPTMLFIPVFMEFLKQKPYFRVPLPAWQSLAIQTLLCGMMLTVSVPMGCSWFPQRCKMKVENLEPVLRDSIRQEYGSRIDSVYFNKGL